MVPIIILLEFPNFRLFKQKPHFTFSTRFVYRNPIYHTSYSEIIEVDGEISFRNPLEKSFFRINMYFINKNGPSTYSGNYEP